MVVMRSAGGGFAGRDAFEVVGSYGTAVDSGTRLRATWPLTLCWGRLLHSHGGGGRSGEEDTV